MIKTTHAVLTALAISFVGAPTQGATTPIHPDLVVRFTVVLPKAKLKAFSLAVMADSKFTEHDCHEKGVDQKVFPLMLYPSDAARQEDEYGDSVFECKIVTDSIYRLFNDKALEFANRNDIAPRYVRLLVFNCINWNI